MKLSETGLTAEELKGLVKKYMIETYERFDFLAETAKDMYLYDENKNVVEKKINEINWDIEAASKGGYDCFMTKEMYEQPKGVEDTLLRRLDENGRIKLDDIKIKLGEIYDTKSSFIKRF